MRTAQREKGPKEMILTKIWMMKMNYEDE